MGNRKKIAKWLRKEAEKLAPEEYQAFHKYSEVQYHKDGDQAYPVYGEIGKHQVNHGRRLKRLFIKHGKKAIDQYFNLRGFKLVKKDEQDSGVIINGNVGGSADSQSSDMG